MTDPHTIQRTGFHEAELDGVALAAGVLRLRLSNIVPDPDSDERVRCDLAFHGVGNLTCDNQPVPAITPEGDDASVLQLDYANGAAALFLDWHRYSERRTQTRAYRFTYATDELRLHPQEPDA